MKRSPRPAWTTGWMFYDFLVQKSCSVEAFNLVTRIFFRLTFFWWMFHPQGDFSGWLFWGCFTLRVTFQGDFFGDVSPSGWLFRVTFLGMFHPQGDFSGWLFWGCFTLRVTFQGDFFGDVSPSGWLFRVTFLGIFFTLRVTFQGDFFGDVSPIRVTSQADLFVGICSTKMVVRWDSRGWGDLSTWFPQAFESENLCA